MQKEIEISKIKLGNNPRKDLGDLTELTASIKEKGIIEPLVLNKDSELLAGYRRLAAATAAGLKTVPYVEIDAKKEEITEIKLVENIQRKDLTPLDEGVAFKEYLNTTKHDKEYLAKKISKTKQYIQRRLNLINITKEVEKALKENKIELGHANLLSQMKNTQQKEALEYILDWDLTVQNFSDQIRWMQKIDFENLKFRCGDTKQKTLFESAGNELNPVNNVEDELVESDLFKKEISEYVESQRDHLRKKGIKVFNSKEELIKQYPHAKEIRSWEEGYNKIVNSLPGSKDYVSVIDLGYSDLKKSIYSIKQEKEKQPETKKQTEKQREEKENMLNMNREEKLKSRIDEFRRSFLIEKCQGSLKLSTTLKALVLSKLSDDFGEYDNTFEELLQDKNNILDEKILGMSGNIIPELDTDDIILLKNNLSIDYKKEFILTEEYLKLYQKPQLIELAKELNIDVSECNKNPEFVKEILDNWKPGQVPKLLGEK